MEFPVGEVHVRYEQLHVKRSGVRTEVVLHVSFHLGFKKRIDKGASRDLDRLNGCVSTRKSSTGSHPSVER